jgi:hypothetical protein
MKVQMTEDEKINILMEVARLKNEGKQKEAGELMKTYPLEPEFAQIFKDVYGPEFLIENDYNLTEAEAKYGKDWLNK